MVWNAEKMFLKVKFDLCWKPTLKFLIQITIIYKRQKDSLRLNFHLVAYEFSLLMFQLGNDHENRFYHAILKCTLRLKKPWVYSGWPQKRLSLKENRLVLIILQFLMCNLRIFHMEMPLKGKEFYSNKLWWKQRCYIQANVL